MGGIAAYRMPNGNLEVFAVGVAGNIYHKYQLAPDTGWSGWKSLNRETRYPDISVASNQDGRLQIFVHGADEAVWTQYQNRLSDPNSWGLWRSLGKPGNVDLVPSMGAPVAVLNGIKHMEVLAQNNLNLWDRKAQNAPNVGWDSWTIMAIDDFAAVLGSYDAALDNHGRISLFTGERYQRQTAVGSSTYGGWLPLGKDLAYVVAEPDQEGFIGLVGVDFNFDLWYTRQNSSGDLSGWIRMGSGRTRYRPAMILDYYGRLTAFVHGADNYTYWSRQSSPGSGSWTDWMRLRGATGLEGDAEPAAAVNVDGRLEVFILKSDLRIYHAYELSAGGDWSDSVLLTP